jgi:hypothetical protein
MKPYPYLLFKLFVPYLECSYLWIVFLEGSQSIRCGVSYPQIQDTILSGKEKIFKMVRQYL